MGIRSKLYRKEVNGLFYCRHCNEYKTKDSFRSNKSNLKHGIVVHVNHVRENIKRKKELKKNTEIYGINSPK